MVLTPTETDIIKGIPIPFLPKRDAVCSLSDVGCYNKWTPKDIELWERSGPKPVKSFIKYITGEKLPGELQLSNLVLSLDFYAREKKSSIADLFRTKMPCTRNFVSIFIL